jgi:hypothetical protein
MRTPFGSATQPTWPTPVIWLMSPASLPPAAMTASTAALMSATSIQAITDWRW